VAKRKNNQQVSPRVQPSADSSINPGTRRVEFFRDELNVLLPIYYMIRDVIQGEQAIKGLMAVMSGYQDGVGNGGIPLSYIDILITRAIRYLPMPNAEDQSNKNRQRYKAYVLRAQWYNVTARTLEGMVGQVFLRPPEATIPTELEMLTDDADGGGLSLVQTAARCVRHALSYGRGGILIDYPVTNGQVTKKDLEEGDIRPTLIVYNPWDIINWRVEMRGAKKVLVFLVLREVLDEEGDDGFQMSTYTQYRVLRLDPETGWHTSQTYRKNGPKGPTLDETYRSSDTAGYSESALVSPTNSKGQPFDYIPFQFFGSENNDVLPNKPPLYDIAALNIGHYRNSADYEESCFLVGQPTIALSGLSEDWVANQLQGAVSFGSRGTIPLPVGAKAEILQVKANSMPMEAMKEKEAQMVALGAKLVQPQRVAKTATQQIIETTSESSPLANIAKNVSTALVWALGVAADFVGAAKDKITYKLNQDFDLTSMTADDQNATILQWQSGALASSEMRTVLRKSGNATLTDVEWKAEVRADIEAGIIADPVAPVETPDVESPNDGGVPAPGGSGTPPAKGRSGAGGPQPGARRRLSPPKGSK
jgi:uncharacterized protein DUF4055